MTGLNKADLVLMLIGRMIMAWNSAETIWFLIYTCLVHELPRPVAEAIFKRNQTGNSQRDLILTIASVALSNHKDILSFLNSAKTETNNLAVERNDIVHGNYTYAHENIAAALSNPQDFILRMAPGGDKNKRPNLFSGKHLDQELPPFIADIEQLITQLMEARHHILWNYLPPGPHALPLPESMPEDMRARLLLSHPELEPPKTPLIWRPIRPIARSQT
jgi:hypothetical protein